MTADTAGIVEVEGARLRYRIEGHGEPCLVVGSSVVYPRMFSPQLREHLQLVFFDLRQYAESDPSLAPDRISVETYVDDIERVRETLGLGDVVVIGHSIHGTIALEHARRHPEHVRGVVAVAAYPRRSDETPTPGERFWDADASEERKEILARQLAELTPEIRARLSPEEMFVRNYVANGPRFWLDATYDASWLWDGVTINNPLLQHLYGELFKTWDLAQEPGEIGVPVLVVHGRYDYAIPHTLWDEHRHKLPRHSYVLLDRSAHSPSLEEPERFDQTLLAWVNGLNGAGI